MKLSERQIRRRTLMAFGALALLLLVWGSFGGRGDERMLDLVAGDPALEEAPSAGPEAVPPVAPIPEFSAPAPEKGQVQETDGVLAMLSPADTLRARNRYEAHFDSMPPGGVKMRINYLGGTLGRVFNDSNYLHIRTAEAIGIRPVTSPADAWRAGASVERLASCREYYLDNLTHSLPYLVPKAHRLLTDIGAAFRDSLQARGGGDYRIKVTSVLRTPALVRKLRRRNRNAVDTSAHLFGTTFDISYAKFICDSVTVPRTQEDLKNLLGEVVNDMRSSGRCYVKYEHKQACFHITAR